MTVTPDSIDAAARFRALPDPAMQVVAAEPDLGGLVRVAALVCDAPVSLVRLDDRTSFSANARLQGVGQTPQDAAFCAQMVLSDHFLEIPDTTTDPVFSGHPFVAGHSPIRFFAGMPLLLIDGSRVGTLCVIDREPRRLNFFQREMLVDLARAMSKAIEVSIKSKEILISTSELQDSAAVLELIVNKAPYMMAYWDRDLNCRFANRVYERWFGTTSDSLPGTNLHDLLGPELFALNKPHIDRALAGGEQTFERTLILPCGEKRHNLAHYVPDIVDGEVKGFLALVSDVTALKKAEASLQVAQRLGGIGSWEWSAAGDVATWSVELYHLTGLDPARPAPSFAEQSKLYAPESWARLQSAVETALRDGVSYCIELQFLRPDGRSGWFEARGEVLVDALQKTVGLRGTVQDITERRDLVAELADQHELLRVTLQSIGDAVITTDARGIVTWLNPVAAQLTGWQPDPAVGRAIGEVFNTTDEETRRLTENSIDLALRQGRVVDRAGQTLLLARDGQEFSIEDVASPIRSRSGELLGAVLVFRDVTEQRRLANELSHRARHDGLTGLINRAEFEICLQRALGDAQVHGTTHALLYIDLDRFKIVNDTCGHSAGDLLLRQVANLLRDTVRNGDTIARLGGDEFAILLESCSCRNAERVAQKICDLMDEYRFIHGGTRFRIGASIGLLAFDRHWDTTTTIMLGADSACYAAKQAGRNCVHAWFDADHLIHARQGEMQCATRLEAALTDGQFRLFAQRIVPVDGVGTSLHLEVLLRLAEVDGTMALPGSFLPVAERFRMASRIDRFVLEQVTGLLADLPGLAGIGTISINLSGQSIADRAFHGEAIGILRAAGPSVCRCICLEITDAAAIANMADAGHFIERMQQLGVRIALDDFGAGAATFRYLKSLKIDLLKIDGQLVRNLTGDPLDEAAVRCFVDVARILGIKVVAECVETDAVLSRLNEMGVDYAQGYLFHRPEPIEKVICALAVGSV